MPSQLARNIQTGLSIASQFQAYGQKQREIEEQKRLAMERQQLDGALKSMAKTGGIIPDDMKEEINPRVTMKAQKMFLDNRLESLNSERGVREEEYLKMTDELLNETIASGAIPDTIEGIFGMFNRFEQEEKYPFTVKVMAAQKAVDFLEKDTQLKHMLDQWQFTQATVEHENFIMNMFKADQFALQGNLDEAVDLVKNTINHSSTPYSLEEQENGGFTIKFDNPLDGDESQILHKDLSFDEIMTEVKRLKLEQYYPLVKVRREQIKQWNVEALQNPEVLYDNHLNEYKIFSFKNPETGEMDVAVETPSGKQITNNAGQVLSFSSPMEARTYLKQHQVDGKETTGLWNDPEIAYKSNISGKGKQKDFSPTDSVRVAKAVEETLDDLVELEFDPVTNRKLSSQVANKVKDGIELNEAIVEVFQQFIEDTPLEEQAKNPGFWRAIRKYATGEYVGRYIVDKVKNYLDGKDSGSPVETKVDVPVVEDTPTHTDETNWENW